MLPDLARQMAGSAQAGSEWSEIQRNAPAQRDRKPDAIPISSGQFGPGRKKAISDSGVPAISITCDTFAYVARVAQAAGRPRHPEHVCGNVCCQIPRDRRPVWPRPEASALRFSGMLTLQRDITCTPQG